MSIKLIIGTISLPNIINTLFKIENADSFMNKDKFIYIYELWSKLTINGSSFFKTLSA
jgi:hypothetical protein